jgi:hypothetical protein
MLHGANVTSSATSGVSSLLLLIIGNCFYGCETWSLTLRDVHVPRVFQIRLVRKMEEGAEVWKNLHNE